jgi:hypothetical protein
MSAKYPRTPHLPFSPGGTKDDRRINDVSRFVGREIVVTEKLDGSNLCLTQENVFARSHSGAPVHPSFDMAKAMHARLQYKLPENYSFFGEWLFAVHSIEYQELPSPFMLFGVRDDPNERWGSWDGVRGAAKHLGVSTAPELFRGTVNSTRELEKLVTRLATRPSQFGGDCEGVVVRVSGQFQDSHFSESLAKWVRQGHVQTDQHWKTQAIRKQNVACLV